MFVCGFNARFKGKHRLFFHGLEGVGIWLGTLSEFGSYLDYDIYTHRKITLIIHICVCMINISILARDWCTEFAQVRDVRSRLEHRKTPRLFCWWVRGKKPWHRQLPGSSTVCTPHTVIIKTGTVALPASWNVYVRRHKRRTDQTCDGVI